MKTVGRFILIDNDKKQQTKLQWKTSSFSNLQSQYSPTKLSYRDKKNLISNLNPHIQSSHSFSQKMTNRRHLVTSSSTNKISPLVYSNTEREKQFTQRILSNKLPSRNASLPQESVEVEEIRNKILEAEKVKGRVICLINMRRFGLRFRLKHAFFVLNNSSNHNSFIREAKQKLFPQFAKQSNRNVYLFHLGKEPINNINSDLNSKEYVIFADLNPKFNLHFDIQMKLFEQASHLEECILTELKLYEENKSETQSSQSIEDQGPKYEWQKIKNIKNHVNQVIDNPELIKRSDEEEDSETRKWFGEKYTEEIYSQEKDGSKIKQEKHPFFDLKCHYPKETADQEELKKVTSKIESLPIVDNRHKFKKRNVENMMEKIKRQNQEVERLKKEEEKKHRLVGYKSQKEFLRELDGKNTALSVQNIPYIMEKYQITRAQAYNLYNIYKSLEKVSAMRLFKNNQFRSVKEKGIDRRTFDEGMKGLEINPGQQVIRNICYFPQFISWEEFVKIVSISLRKTPESKLEAILQGILGSQKGELTRTQIGIMVGSSLSKIFGADEPELTQYFVDVCMKELDKDESGTVDVKELKDHVFQSSIEDMDLVSYLMLNC